MRQRLIALLCMLVMAGPVHAAATAHSDLADVPLGGPAWFADPYAYALVDQDLRSALTEFGHNLGQIVVISDKVKGKARSPLRSRTAGQFLEQLCSGNGLGWFYDGNVLHINTDAEVATRLYRRSPSLNTAQLSEYLEGLDVQGAQLSQRASQDGRELYVSGPPAYFELIQQHLDHQTAPIAEVAAPARGIRVIRGSTVSDH